MKEYKVGKLIKTIGSKPRHGKGYAICIKCGTRFKLRRNTKHNSNKTIKAICSKCSEIKR